MVDLLLIENLLSNCSKLIFTNMNPLAELI